MDLGDRRHLAIRVLNYVLQRSSMSSAVHIFNYVRTWDDPEQSFQAVALFIKYSQKVRNMFELLMHLGGVIIRDNHRQMRVDMVAHLPDCITSTETLSSVFGLKVANLIMEPDTNLFLQAKTDYAELLFSFSLSFVNSNTKKDDRNAIEVMRYLETYVKPTWDIARLQASNYVLTTLADRLPGRKMDDTVIDAFMETLMASTNYDYHAMLAALTDSAENNDLKMKPALEFMKAKHQVCSDNELIGTVNIDLQDQITVEFVRSLLKNLAVYDIERVMNTIDEENIVSPGVIVEIAKVHMADLHKKKENMPENHSLIYFIRQTILSKYYKGDRNNVLKKALHFFDRMNRYGLNLTQTRVFCTIIATQSHPKRKCEHYGNLELFTFLFRRLMALAPPLPHNNVRMDMHSYQTVLFSIYNLFTIDAEMKAFMTRIDPDWKDKLLHALDLNCVTSANLNRAINNTYDYEERRQLLKEKVTVDNTGILLAYVIGSFQGKLLDIHPSFLSPLEPFWDCKITESFTRNFLVSLTKTPSRFGVHVDFPHRRIVEIVPDDGEESDNEEEFEDDEDGDWESSVDGDFDHDDLELSDDDEEVFGHDDDDVYGDEDIIEAHRQFGAAIWDIDTDSDDDGFSDDEPLEEDEEVDEEEQEEENVAADILAQGNMIRIINFGVMNLEDNGDEDSDDEVEIGDYYLHVENSLNEFKRPSPGLEQPIEDAIESFNRESSENADENEEEEDNEEEEEENEEEADDEDDDDEFNYEDDEINADLHEAVQMAHMRRFVAYQENFHRERSSYLHFDRIYVDHSEIFERDMIRRNYAVLVDDDGNVLNVYN